MAASVTPRDRALADLDAAEVRPGQRWQHYKGGRYDVLAVGLLEATLDPIVVYAGHDGVVWVRTLFVWNEEVAPGTRRFTRALRVGNCEMLYDRCVGNACHHALARKPCLHNEGNCKAADCPEHGWARPTETPHPMQGMPRGGRFL